MDKLVQKASAQGIKKIIGYYYPTAKNAMVKEFYETQGFKKIKEDEKALCVSAISEKRASIVCIDNAVEERNELLKGFGFNGFKIEKKDEMSYRLIRADGSEVKETLSEGEHRFITFLYFYQSK